MERTMRPDSEPQGTLPSLVVRLAGIWILVGALFKLLAGTPNDLPAVVRDLPLEIGLEVGLTYKLAIGIELALASLALLRPRWAWLPIVGALLVFDAILVSLLGSESCGCFGSSVTVPPWVMLVIDSALLLAILLGKPWASLPRSGAPSVVCAAAVAIALVLPWLHDREVGSGTVVADGEEVAGAWVELPVERWVGKDIWDTGLGRPPLSEHLDVAALPLDGLWVFYRYTCDHCAEHLAELERTEMGERMVTLVRLKEEHDSDQNRVVHAMPAGDFVVHAELPDTITYVVQTPAEIELEGGRVVAGAEGVDPHDHE